MKKTIVILICLGILSPAFSFAQELPENIDEAREMGERAIEVGERELPGIIQRIWTDEVLPVWQKMYEWFKENIWVKIVAWFEEEFQAEKEEMKEEVPAVTKSLWEKFKELLK
jgi:hypothetical protein